MTADERNEMIEVACVAMYGKNWNGSDDKRPGEKMKDVWRKYAIAVIDAVEPLIRKDKNNSV